MGELRRRPTDLAEALMQRKDTWAYLDRISNDGPITEWMLPNRVYCRPSPLDSVTKSSKQPAAVVVAARLTAKE
jgi:hypothetical protein